MAKKIKLRDKTGEQLIPVTRSTTVEMNDGVTLQTAYEGINSSHYTKEEINEMGYLQNYTEYDPTVPSYVKGITQTDITNWNNKADDALLVTLTGLSEQNDEGETDSIDGVYFTTNKTLSEINSASQVNVLVPAAIASQFGLGSSNIIIYPDTTNVYQFFVENTLVDGNFWGSDGGYARFYVESYKQFMRTAAINSNVDLYGGDVTNEEISDGGWDWQVPSIGVAYGGIQSLDYKIHNELNNASYISNTSLNTTLASYVTSGYYDTSTRKIYLRHGTNVLSEIDANDFIKDGMVDTAYVQGSNLVISFNTDAGKQPVEVPITDIFNPTNYYTKTEINNAGYLTAHQDLSSYVSKTELNAAGYLTTHQDIKTINGNTITGTGDVTISGLPAVNSTYNGKILQVVDGEWTLVTPLNLYSGTGTPNNTQGNNGDLYMQI